jgi:hypothetical protein
MLECSGNRIRVIPNFVSDEDCATAIAMIDKFDSKHALEEFNSNMDVMVVPENVPDGVKIIKKYSDKILEAHREFHGFYGPLFTTEGWLSLWEAGAGTGLHTDSHAGYEYLIFSTVIYLNDSSEYGGGAIYFPYQGFEYRPKKGDAVIFPGGGQEYVHGVRDVEWGRRYTIPMWHTSRLDKASRLFHPGIADMVADNIPSNIILNVTDLFTKESKGEIPKSWLQ